MLTERRIQLPEEISDDEFKRWVQVLANRFYERELKPSDANIQKVNLNKANFKSENNIVDETPE